MNKRGAKFLILPCWLRSLTNYSSLSTRLNTPNKSLRLGTVRNIISERYYHSKRTARLHCTTIRSSISSLIIFSKKHLYHCTTPFLSTVNNSHQSFGLNLNQHCYNSNSLSSATNCHRLDALTLSQHKICTFHPIFSSEFNIFGLKSSALLNTNLRLIHTSVIMAKSKFEYVKQFESDDPCLPNCWLVVRIDGKAFHRFTDNHHYMKPNDDRGLSLMTRAAQHVIGEFTEIVLAYGQSDEYSFVFHKNCKLYNRRASKIMTNVVSLFASAFTLFWNRFFNTQELQYPPSFDARVVLYPSDENLKDYLSWRQADCHINNLYNTCFWKLVQEKGLTPAGAQERLKGTLSSDKNEILFTDFNINYNNLPELYRKGTTLIRPRDVEDSSESVNNSSGSISKSKPKSHKPTSVVLHCDIIGKQFWEEHPYVLNSKRPV